MAIYCAHPWTRFGLVKGNQFGCCFAPEGTLAGWTPLEDGPAETVLSRSWNSPTYQAMRETMAARGSLEVCGTDEATRYCTPSEVGGLLWGDNTAAQIHNARVARESAKAGETVVGHYPVAIDLMLDLLCQLRCIHCWQATARRRGDLRELDLSVFTDELVTFIRHARQMTVLGGEPTVSSQWPSYLAACRAAGVRNTNVATNGQLLEAQVIPNLDVIASVHLSVDAATPEMYARCRVGGSWSTLVRGLDALTAHPQAPAVLCHFVLTRVNVSEATQMIEFAAQHGVQKVVLSAYCPVGAAGTALLPRDDEERAEYARRVSAARARAADLGLDCTLIGGLEKP